MAAVAALAPSAQAHDNFPAGFAAECANPNSEVNTPLTGVGASFQRSAQVFWGADAVDVDRVTLLEDGSRTAFGTAVGGACASTFVQNSGRLDNLRYRPEGSGAGRSAFGATGVTGAARDATVSFGGTDEPPTTAQIASANTGPDGTTPSADDDTLHSIPNAQGAIAVLLRIPDNCQINAASDATGTLRRLGRTQIDNGFAARTAADTWGELTQNRITASAGGGLTDAQCRAKNFSRVVRLDNGGTTFQFKRYLAEVRASGVTWSEPTLANTAWPASGVNPVVTGAGRGNGPLVAELNGAAHAANGAIGYSDLATARNGGFGWDGTHTDRRIWAYVQRIADTSFRSPAVDNAQSGTRGSNCEDVEYNDYSLESDPDTNGAVLPGSTTGTWINVDAVRTTEDYPICTLTYALSFEHPNTQAFNSVVDWTTARARARKSYINYTINGGQSVLRSADYDALPGAVQSVAQAGVNNLGD